MHVGIDGAGRHGMVGQPLNPQDPPPWTSPSSMPPTAPTRAPTASSPRATARASPVTAWRTCASAASASAPMRRGCRSCSISVRPHTGPGDGEALQDYLAGCVAKTQRIGAYAESIPNAMLNETAQKKVKLGSLGHVRGPAADMQCGRDMLVLIHGYNVGLGRGGGHGRRAGSHDEPPRPGPARRRRRHGDVDPGRSRGAVHLAVQRPGAALRQSTRATAPTPPARPARSAAAC